MDREDFYRLKKVAGKKARDVAAADAEMKAKREAQAKKDAGQENVDPDCSAGAPADLLAAEGEDDVIF